MAVDRYVAICKPLHYMSIMNRRVCSVLVAIAWVGACVHSSVQIFLTLSLHFCGLSVIDHYLCDLHPLLKLACTDTYVTNLLLVSSSGAISIMSFVMLIFSYVIILYSLRNHSAKGRKKALATCISHIIVVILFCSLWTLLGNSLIIITIKTSWALGSPMYFFLFYLSLSDTYFSTSIAPRMIVDTLLKNNTISFNECMIQIFSLHFFGCQEILILVLTAVDRYVAICKPLHYMSIMTQWVCSVLVAIAWVGACVHSSVQIFLTLSLPFCGPNVIDHYLCDFRPLLKLACTDTYVINLLLVSNSGALCIMIFIMRTFSYVIILHSLRNHSAEGRKKALSICISRIIVVILFFVPCIFIYTCPTTTFPMDMITVFYRI
ncbi:olfactory receptor 4C16-like [Elephas maximus indicus]|uniref:olfactory receptor 4C16-like n=1 Tax=Elephas maximus indicus TaxID=99487 RepID=UPI002115E66E|nr:olfactory receptor 4C16-like [Elephas maximus indicus]